MELQHSPFPSEETLAAFIDGRLDPPARKEVMKHLADCAECRDLVLMAKEMEESNVVRGVNWQVRMTYTLAAAAAIAVVVLMTPVRERIWPSEMQQLARVAPAKRIGMGRISGFPYRPKAATFRGPGDSEKEPGVDEYKFLAAAAQVEGLHARGAATLAEGKASEAIPLLEAAAKSAPNDEAVLSDLAAAYIAADEPTKALAKAERAWQLKETPQTAWNRAAAAETAHSPQAISYWNDYLKLDATSPWADEAKEHIRKLEHPDEL